MYADFHKNKSTLFHDTQYCISWQRVLYFMIFDTFFLDF